MSELNQVTPMKSSKAIASELNQSVLLVNRDSRASATVLACFFVILLGIPTLGWILRNIFALDWSNLLSTGSGFAFVFWLLRSRLLKTGSPDLLFVGVPYLWIIFSVVLGAILALLGTLASLTELYCLNIFSESYAWFFAEQFFSNPILAAPPTTIAVSVAIYCLLIPVAEEYLFRQYLLGNLMAHFSAPKAIGSAVVLFSLLHAEFFAHAIYAVVLIMLVLASRSLLPAIVTHACLNALAFVIPAILPSLRTGKGAMALASSNGPLLLISMIILAVCLLAGAGWIGNRTSNRHALSISPVRTGHDA